MSLLVDRAKRRTDRIARLALTKGDALGGVSLSHSPGQPSNYHGVQIDSSIDDLSMQRQA
jgi:hypothetical protein